MRKVTILTWAALIAANLILLTGAEASLAAGSSAKTLNQSRISTSSKKPVVTPKSTVKATAKSTIVPTTTPQPTMEPTASPMPTPTDEKLFSFTTVGDSRTDGSVQTNLSAQDVLFQNNSKVMQRMMDDAVANQSKLFLFNGDMIMGYTPNSDVNALNRQYAYWRGLVAQSFEHGMYVIPVPGNHETQDKYKDDAGKTVKKATVANENTWRSNMSDIILDMYRWKPVTGESITSTNFDPNNTPAIGTDGITSDQTRLTYSFDYKDSHFTVLNTDAAGNDIHAPLAWLENDLSAAKKRGIKHMFVFAHRPVYTYKYSSEVTPGGLDTDLKHADAAWNIIEKYGATYFCGHEHIYNVSQPLGKSHQVIVGSGGSPFEATKPTTKRSDQMYAWANVDVYKSGKIHMTIHGFDDTFGPNETIDSFDWNE